MGIVSLFPRGVTPTNSMTLLIAGVNYLSPARGTTNKGYKLSYMYLEGSSDLESAKTWGDLSTI